MNFSLTETPWTEIPLDRDPPGQRSPPWTKTPTMDRDPPGQRTPGQRIYPLDRDPLSGQRSPWTETPRIETPHGQTNTCENIALRAVITVYCFIAMSDLGFHLGAKPKRQRTKLLFWLFLHNIFECFCLSKKLNV